MRQRMFLTRERMLPRKRKHRGADNGKEVVWDIIDVYNYIEKFINIWRKESWLLQQQW